MMRYGGYPMMYGWGGFGWIFTLIFWFLVIVLIASLIGWAAKKDRRSDEESDKEDTPLEILKMRYAKGEIDKKEYEEKKKELS